MAITTNGTSTRTGHLRLELSDEEIIKRKQKALSVLCLVCLWVLNTKLLHSATSIMRVKYYCFQERNRDLSVTHPVCFLGTWIQQNTKGLIQFQALGSANFWQNKGSIYM